MADGTTLIDCRWLGYTGVGRVTEYLLRGLAEVDADGPWLLWGPLRVEAFGIRDAVLVPNRHSPLGRAGQADALHVPKADRYLFLHTVRPFTPHPNTVLVHDTIPIRWAPTRAQRMAWRSYLQASVRMAARVLVYSEATRRRVAEDLGVRETIRVHLPSDAERAKRIHRLRKAVQPDNPPTMLYVGLDRPQKNLERAIRGFARSRFAANGGQFLLVGIGAPSVSRLGALACKVGATGVRPVATCTDEELEANYARAQFVIQPSLEEGYGLPVAEALDAGIPVCCSTIDSLFEAAAGRAVTFDPLDVDDIGDAIDTVAFGGGIFASNPRHSFTTAQFAQELIDSLA